MDSDKKSAKTIMIDLRPEKIRDARAFENPEEFIQQEVMLEFFELISQSLDIAKSKKSEENNYSSDFDRIRYHNTITISGARGSGKTTFILNMFKVIRDNKASKLLDKQINEKDLEILDILDPTLIEDKEHVFVNIISRIKETVDRKREGRCERQINHEGRCPIVTEDAEGKYQDWLKCLRKLAAGLPAIDGVGSDNFLKSEQWHDPIHVMEQGLKNTNASNHLEINFNKFLNKSLEIIDKKAFILAFDDIDTRFSAGWPVLETIRKYLTSPQLIIILSGDLSLYSKLIRRYQWKNFGGTLLGQERFNKDSNDSFALMVNELEDQYLLKIFKPERRLELKTIYEILQHEGKDRPTIKGIMPATWVKPSERELKYLICRLFQYTHLIVTPKVESKDFKKNKDLLLYLDNLSREPVRTIIQLVYGFINKAYRNSSGDANNTSVSNHDDFIVDQGFINTLVDTFLVSLHQYGFKASFAKKPDPLTFLNNLVLSLSKKNILERGYRLKAEFDDPSLNRLMWVLGAVGLYVMRNNPELYFEYLIKVGLSRELALRFPNSSNKDGLGTLDNYLSWVGVKDGENAMTIASMATGYMRNNVDAPNKPKPTHLGTVALKTFNPKRGRKISSKNGDLKKDIEQLYNISIKDDEWNEGLLDILADNASVNKHMKIFIEKTAFLKGTASLREIAFLGEAISSKRSQQKLEEGNEELPYTHKAYYCNSLQELETGITSWHRYLIISPAQQLIDKLGQRNSYYSIHCLFALVASIIGPGEIDKKKIIKFGQLLDYPRPSWGDTPDSKSQQQQEIDSQVIGEEEDEDGGDNNPSLSEKPFFNALAGWRKYFRKTSKEFPLPPHIWTKIFVRFYYSIGRVDQDLGSKDRYLGFIFHRYIIIFLNAVLVEESLFQGLDVAISLKNPTNKDDIFKTNINKIYEYDKKLKNDVDREEYLFNSLKFFSAVYACPIWYAFLDLDSNEYLKNHLIDAMNIINKRSGIEIDILKELKCDYYHKAHFTNLYPILNSVVVYRDQVDKVIWNIEYFEEIIEGRESEIRKNLKSCKDETEATEKFRELYLDPIFTRTPKNKKGKTFIALVRRIRSAGLYKAGDK